MRFVLAALALCAFSTSTVFAGDTPFPKTGDAMFTITVPESWEVESDDESVLEAQSPKENISLTVWEIDSEVTVAKLARDLKDILKDYATNVKLEDEPKQIEIDGLPGILMVGTGDDEDDGHEVGFVALVLVKGDDAAIVFFEMDGNVTPGELKKFSAIIDSIKAAE
jgi:hypothetical protein